MTNAWYTRADIYSLTSFNAGQLRRRIQAGLFPPPVDADRWNRADVDEAMGRRAQPESDDSDWKVDHAAIEMAVSRYIRRSAKLTAAGRGRRNVAHSIRGAGAPAAIRMASNNLTPSR